LVQADVLALPFATGTFDAAGTIMLFDVLGEQDVRDALVEFARIITPGGRAVIGSIRFSNGFVKRGWMMAYNLLPGILGIPNPTDVDDYLDDAGLRVLRDEEIEGILGVRLLTLMKVVG
jgi:ubiquinone/menaquinone biosynthesis C-methylase UbiE